MSLATDQKSIVQLISGSNKVVFPLLRGSRFMDDPNVVSEFLASNSYFEPMNWVAGLYQPAIFVRTRVFPNWFNQSTTYFTTAFFDKLLGLPSVRDSTSGLIPSLGEIHYSHANGTKQKFSECKLARAVIRMSGVGAPLEANLLFMPYGTPSASPTLDPGAVPYGMPIHGIGCTFTGINEVWDFTLTIDNGLQPDNSAPATPMSGSNRILPAGYTNSPFRYMFQATMNANVADVETVGSHNLANPYAVTLNIADPAGNGLSFAMNFTAGSYEETVQEDVSLKTCSWASVRGASATSLAVTAITP